MESGQLVFTKAALLLTMFTLIWSSMSWGGEFIITYWCGPPLKETSEERYKEVKEAGFDTAFVSIDGAFNKDDNFRLLDIASNLGLKCIIADPRLSWDLPQKPDWQKVLDEIVKDYSSHPALFGYYLMDEPNASHFPLLGELVSYLREKDPQHIAYINLFPDYATPQQLGTPTYKEHIQRFTKVVKPQILSYDYYTFLQDGDRETFFQNLQVVREESQKARIPFMVIIQMTTHGGYRDLKKEEIAWQAFNCLAYGAKGISYFTYWTPSDDPVWHWRNGIITWEGKRTPHYEEVKEINREIKVLGDFLYNLKSVGAYHIGEVPKGGKNLPSGAPISRIEGGNATLGFFKDASGLYYCLIVNMDYRNQREFKVYLQGDKMQMLNTDSGKWQMLKPYEEDKGNYFELSLPAGGGVLLKL